MRADLLKLAAELAARGEPYVLGLVVRREASSSAQQGDMAVITSDGSYHGWLGGNCTQPTIKREAKRALLDGKPRLVSLSPEPSQEKRAGILSLPMTCHSGGTVEIYLEPVLPMPRLLLFGISPTVRALIGLGKSMGYRVDVVAPVIDHESIAGADRMFDLGAKELSAPASDGGRLFAIIASMGENDEDSLQAALAVSPAYVAIVASKKRYSILRETLLGRGVSAELLATVKNPAGLDIGARTAEELALSVLAEIVQTMRAREAAGEPVSKAPLVAVPDAREEIDPICGMTVEVATARHKATHDGREFYFCNPRCKEKFLADPAHYLPVTAEVAR